MRVANPREHGNDIEVLGRELAKVFPGLDAGDIMVSLRNIDTDPIIDGTRYPEAYAEFRRKCA